VSAITRTRAVYVPGPLVTAKFFSQRFAPFYPPADPRKRENPLTTISPRPRPKLFGKYWGSGDAPRHPFQFTRATLRQYLEGAGFKNVQMTTRTGSTSWVRGFRHTLNGWFGQRWQNDPGWLCDVFESAVVAGSLVHYFGVGSELRVTAERVG